MVETLLLGIGIAVGLAAAAFFAACEGAFLALSTASASGGAEEAPAERTGQRQERLRHGIALGHFTAVVWLAALVSRAVAIATGGPGALGWTLAAVAAGFLLFVFAELAPKAAGSELAGRWAGAASGPLEIWLAVTSPFVALLQALAGPLRRAIGTTPPRGHPSSEEMRTLVTETTRRSDLDVEERRMIASIFEFGETTVREVMTPRPDVFALAADTPLEEAVRLIRDAQHSRVPVHSGSLDEVLGILYAKDLLACAYRASDRPPPLKELLREATFVPEAKRIDDLLREFQAGRIHLAVVVDEYGGTAGIVTLEDILEEFVGEIQDERDREAPLVEELADESLRVDGRLDFDDFNEITGSRLDAPEVETVGGLVTRELGRVPRQGDEVALGGWRFRVEAVAGKRITRLHARRSDEDEEERPRGADGRPPAGEERP